ncbi:MAG: hypothetical protein V4844_03455 [Pseudomonadota bacterium]
MPDLNTARVLAAAPKLLDGFYEMNWVLNEWFVHGFNGVGQSEARDGRHAEVEKWLRDLKDFEMAACARDGRFPL